MWSLMIAAFGYLLYRLITFPHYAEVGERFSHAGKRELTALIAALVLVPIQIAAEARRWQVILRGIAQISFTASWKQVVYGFLGAFITPYRLGEYPARLLYAGYSHEEALNLWYSTLKSNWRTWLTDWKKWLHVLLLTLLRYIIWGIQLFFVLYFCTIHLTLHDALIAIPIYYFLISIMPSMPALDVPIKGGWAVAVFSHYTDNIPMIALAVTCIWLLNTVIPMLCNILWRKSHNQVCISSIL